MMSNSVTPGAITHQTPLSMGFSQQEYWSELACPLPGDPPDPGIEPTSPALQADFFTSTKAQGLGKYFYVDRVQIVSDGGGGHVPGRHHNLEREYTKRKVHSEHGKSSWLILFNNFSVSSSFSIDLCQS